MTRLSKEEKDAIYEEYKKGGISQLDLAVKYGVSHSLVANIIKNKRKEEKNN